LKFFWIRLQRIVSKNSIPKAARESSKLLKNLLFPHDAKKIHGTSKKLFRIRIGDFRILYRIDYEETIIITVSVDSRKRVYRDFEV
jgi:mRNA interferase RelE/StbE